jgi:hypothetical protein
MGMPGLPAYSVQQQRPTSDRLGVLARIGQSHEQRPPILDQRDDPSHQPAARQIASGEAAPAPVVLQFIEIVLGIRAVAIRTATSLLWAHSRWNRCKNRPGTARDTG